MRSLIALTWVELKLFAREPFSLIFTLVFPVVLLVVLIGSFPPDDPAFGAHRPADYYLATYVGVVIGAVGLISLPVHLATYRERGILRRFQASAVPAWVVIGSHLITGLVMAALSSIVLLIAATTIYDAAPPQSLAPVAGVFVLATVSFLAIGVLLGSIVRTAQAAQAIGMLLFLPMWLLCGAGPPPEVMSAGMRHLSDVMPLTFAVRAIQQPWLGDTPSGLDLLVLTAILAVAGICSARALRTRA